MDETTNKSGRLIPWLLFVIVTIVPFLAWSYTRSWNYESLTLITIFPLLGLWAWGIMWTHYAYGGLRLVFPSLQKNKTYSKLSGALVLALILLHPVLLAASQWQNTKSLPPGSIYSYVLPEHKIYILLGTIGLILFLSFEIFERIKNNPYIKKHWKWISLSQMLAMVLIFFHALSIGSAYYIGWFEFYWVVLGALLIPCFGLIGRADWQNKPYTPPEQIS